MTDAALPAPAARPKPAGKVAEFFESWVATGALAVLVLIVLAAVFAPLISAQDPTDLAVVSIMDARQPPGSEAFDGFTMWLGSDGSGRDMLSAILYGLRISLTVGVTAGVVALLIGMAIGLVAAYAGGRIEALIMRLVDLQLSFPAALIALMLVAMLGPGTVNIILALVIAQWAYYARTVRASALVERRKEYVEAAQCLGLSHERIVFLHILPNCLAPLIVVGTVQVASAISLEATLSFLGVGIKETEPSLGVLIDKGFDYILSGSYWISTFPGIALLILVVSVNLVGDRLRDILNPRLQR